MNKQQAGFTLIELVLVIVILGILAATAIPRFSDLTAEARRADLQGMRAALQSAAAIAHATQLAQGLASNSPITMEGTSVAMTNGYPDDATGGINNTLASNVGFTFVSPGQFDKDGGTSGTCSVTYADSIGGAFPVISISSGGC